MVLNVIQVALILFVPALVLWLAKRIKLIEVLSPVLICYLAGILMANQSALPVNLEISMFIRNITVAVAIPLLLFSVDIIGWLRLSRSTVISFLLCIASVMIMSTIGHFIFRGSFSESSKIAGMLVGVYTGGTPNLNAIGTGLNINPEMFIILESVDMIMGASYLIFLFTFGPRILKHILPTFPKNDENIEAEIKSDIKIKHVIIALLFTVLIVAVSAGLGEFLPKSIREAGIILLITTFAIFFSLKKKVRELKGTHESGMYVLLIFCVAVGSCAKFETLISTSWTVFAYIALVMFGAIFLHVLFAWLLKIDRDTVIITSTAGIFGPAFVGPVAQALKNREIFFSGIATGLVGYAIGNYMGLALAWILDKI